VKLLPNETCLTGKWVLKDGRVVADDVCGRIEDLTRSRLQQLGRDASGWDALFVDLEDGRLWELVYPESGQYGGGAPELRHLSAAQAKEKYGKIVPRAV
jgi:hypothetical protein